MFQNINKPFHFQIFPLLLSKLGPDNQQSNDSQTLPWQLVETALTPTLSAMAQHSDREHLAELWDLLLVSKDVLGCTSHVTCFHSNWWK